MVSKRFARLLALGWVLLIVAACSVPGAELPPASFQFQDKAAHFFLFFVLGWLWMQASETPLNRRTRRVLLAGIAFGILLEFYQGLLPFDRSPEASDALANSLGLLVAVLVYRLWHARTSAQRT